MSKKKKLTSARVKLLKHRRKMEMRRYRKKNPEVTEKYNKVSRRKRKIFVDELKNNPCSDCRKSYPPHVMDFDHVRGVKVQAVSALLRQTNDLERVRAEISKCDLVCSNCHRERTWKRKLKEIN